MKMWLLLLLFVTSTCIAQDSKLEVLDRRIAQKEKELETLKAERAKLAGEAKPTPQEQAMWKDPMYAKHRIELQRLEAERVGLKEKIETLVREESDRRGAYSAQGIIISGRPDDRSNLPKDMQELYSRKSELLEKQKENDAAIGACELALLNIRKKYGVTSTK